MIGDRHSKWTASGFANGYWAQPPDEFDFPLYIGADIEGLYLDVPGPEDSTIQVMIPWFIVEALDGYRDS